MSHKDYPNAEVLDARVHLHEKCSTNPYGWHRWVMDHIIPHLRGTVLEVGTGPAYLWAENRERIPRGVHLVLSDRSPGMVRDAREKLGLFDGSQAWLNCDVAQLPFDADRFDTVIANHLLFLLEDPAGAVEQLAGSLIPGGVLCATTNHRDHLLGLMELFVNLSEDHFGHLPTGESVLRRERFNFVSGAALLVPYFEDIQLVTYEDGLEIDRADILEPWMVYWAEPALDRKSKKRLLDGIDEKIAIDGKIRIRKNSGMFIARKDVG
jgi:SAM-dependent methyltransferase